MNLLEAIQTRQTELESLIKRYAAQVQAVTPLRIAEAEVLLRPGDHYAGAVLDEAGQVKHHLVLLHERPDDTVTWDEAKVWAESIGGTLPTRQEQALLYANGKPHLDPTWHWSSEEHSASYAWLCYFSFGYQLYGHKSFEGRAVAVRRFSP